MKLVLSVFLFAMTLQAQSANLEDFVGTFRASSESGPLQVATELGNNGLLLTFTKGKWSSKVRGRTYSLGCRENLCSGGIPEMNIGCRVGLELLDSGNILFRSKTPKKCEGRFLFKPYDGIPTGRGRWKVSQTVDPDGKLIVTASVVNKLKKSSLSLTCWAPSSESSMTIEINETLWRAIAYSVNTKQERLVVSMKIGKTSFSLEEWQADEDNLLIRLDSSTADELAKLSSGNTTKFTFSAVSQENVVSKLGTLKFTLRGSANAIKDMQKRCSGEVSDSISFAP